MVSIQKNVEIWNSYAWSESGDEWSRNWGGTELLWWGSIYPRIQAFVPTGTILEIAPGFGRCTRYLKDLAQQLYLVDVTERCIEACKQRFAGETHITYAVNDGKSLAMIPDGSIDFVFSFDSLVHAERDVLQAYLQQLARKLKPQGVGFMHHSNIGAFVKRLTRRLPFDNVHMRARSVTAKLVVDYCERAGLHCVGQELINWGDKHLIDCFTTFVPSSSPYARPTVRLENPNFMDEAKRCASLSTIYHPRHFHPEIEAAV